ncbi:MAG TPA: PAS domain S-box protein [Longimicrobiaceae bacterium]|nr:PAS domain S-box protein [Longimicrobiaceae bacterium]
MNDRAPVNEFLEADWHRHLLHDLQEYAVFALDLSGAIADWGPAAERMTGLPAPDVLGRPIAELWPIDRREKLSAILEDAAARRGASGETRYSGLPTGDAWVEETITPIHEGTEVIGFSVIARDVTQRRRSIDFLLQSKATFEGILAIASDAVVCVNEEQRITFFNHGAEEIFQYAAKEVLGEPLEILIPQAHRPGHAEQVRRFAESAVTARRMGERGEITGRRKDGEIFPAEASISQLTVGSTRVFTAVLRDVTERRRSEEALAANARELERSNAELEQFAYVASHDLQEPLRMVASYTQLLARRYRGQLDEDADEFIGYAVDGVTRMQALISDLLAYSRVGRREVEPAAVPMNALLDRVLLSLGPSIEEKGAVVTRDPLPSVSGDQTQLEQLLQNLIANAIKFHGEKPPRVHVSATADGDEWTFSVRDEGIGIDPQFQERIFVIFQRLHSRNEYPGTGIGLAICRKIVERQGGRMWLESAPGKGSTFFFTLPVTQAANP